MLGRLIGLSILLILLCVEPSNTNSVHGQLPELVVPQIDGVLSDWGQADVAKTDPCGDATGAFDLTEVSVRVVGTQVFLKFDTGRELNPQSGQEEDGMLILEFQLRD